VDVEIHALDVRHRVFTVLCRPDFRGLVDALSVVRWLRGCHMMLKRFESDATHGLAGRLDMTVHRT
jgi:hypothetical protein